LNSAAEIMRRNRVQAASVRRKASESFTGKKLINNIDINEGLKKRIKIPWIKISIGKDLLRKIVLTPYFSDRRIITPS